MWWISPIWLYDTTLSMEVWIFPRARKSLWSQQQSPYSLFNINQKIYNNAFFQYSFSSSTSTKNCTVNIPNGFYDVTSLNTFLQQVMIQNGNYLINTNGQYVYYIQLLYNITYYSVQIITYSVPTSLPSSWINPVNMTFLTSPTTPQFTVLNNNFGSIIGYSVGSYPSAPMSSNQSFVSNIVPNATPVNSLILHSSFISNNCTFPSDVITSIPITNTYGSNINYSSYYPTFVKNRPGKYAFMDLMITDQNNNTVMGKDPNLCITFLLRIGGSSFLISNWIANNIKFLILNYNYLISLIYN